MADLFQSLVVSRVHICCCVQGGRWLGLGSDRFDRAGLELFRLALGVAVSNV